MPLKTAAVLCGLGFILIFICGCTGLTKAPVHKTYFDLAVTPPSSDRYNFCNDLKILVKQLDINPTFDSHSFVYRLGENEYVMDYYSEFINSPARLITEKIEAGLCDTSRLTSMNTNQKHDTTFRLSGKITRLYADLQDLSHPMAIIEIRITLEKNNGSVSQPFFSKTYSGEETILSRDPSRLVSGWNAGLSKILQELITDLQTTVLP